MNLSEAKTRLSELLRRLEQGEEIVIALRNKPRAKLVLIDPEGPAPREWGLWRGKVRMSDDFDAPLEDLADYT